LRSRRACDEQDDDRQRSKHFNPLVRRTPTSFPAGDPIRADPFASANRDHLVAFLGGVEKAMPDASVAQPFTQLLRSLRRAGSSKTAFEFSIITKKLIRHFELFVQLAAAARRSV